MGLLLWIIFGALAGWIASSIMGASERIGLVGEIIVGMVGAVVGGWLANGIGESGVGGFDLYSFIVAVVGACVFIAALRLLRI